MSLDMTHFVPGPRTAGLFRTALGSFATGVTVVTCRSEAGPLGMTANSFTSVSLDPPLILWCPARTSSRCAAFTGAERFAIHVLADGQRDLCRRFAADGLSFDGLDWDSDEQGVPRLAGCLARLECRRHAVHDGGDHAIVLGEVTAATLATGHPLVFSGGAYGGFSKC